MKRIRVTILGRYRGTGMGFNTVVFAECLVKVELQAANSDFHAAVVESCHRIGRYWDIVWQRDSGKNQEMR